VNSISSTSEPRTAAKTAGTPRANEPAQFASFATSLEALCQCDPAWLHGFNDNLAHWIAVRDRCQWEENKNRRISPNAGAKLIAATITSGLLEPAQIIRLARLELGREWPKDDQSIEDALQQLVKSMSASFASTNDRLRAISRFRSEAAVRRLGRWDMVENFLLQQCYSWLTAML
jgi:hypothetical protein